ncbi:MULTISPECIES: IS701 family transposase [Methylomicrobium]|uniref:Transposase family protein n=1 Tax=Methylomicrobium album BG8 TaxID=686340 RepID=H8GHE1_METAL|nr:MULTISPECIES: transposase [Methylomicrobium]EIC30093.1 transposase family protein [Methylomicrobium album BG8]
MKVKRSKQFSHTAMTRLDYCQFLLVSQINYTLTYFADHHDTFSHDAINRYLRRERMTPRLIWDNVRDDIVPTLTGYLLFDDTVLDKDYSRQIELVRCQYSGNAHGLIRGIGVVTCVYVNPALDQFWLIDYRLYDPEGDGKSTLGHVHDMLSHAVYHKHLPFHAVLMDTGYATKDLMLFIESLQRVYYCPLKANRQVDDSGGECAYQRVDALTWASAERQHGKRIKIKGFPKHHKVQLFRVAVSTHRTDWVVTNDPTQHSLMATQQVCGYRWKIEQLHREGKQVTGMERCQCRTARIQRNHIACAFLVWVRRKQFAYATGRTVYQLKQDLLDDYLCQQLRNSSLRMQLA